jgi:hypothetical protein
MRSREAALRNIEGTRRKPKLSQELKTGNRNSKERRGSMTVNLVSKTDLKMQR